MFAVVAIQKNVGSYIGFKNRFFLNPINIHVYVFTVT